MNKSIYLRSNSDITHHLDKFGFTLAEVLITLGIIGIVAALTIPAVIQNTKKQEASSRLKKFISAINQTLIYAEADYGPREGWSIGEMESSDSAFDFLNTYIKPYVKSFEIEKRQLLNKNMATLRFVDGSQMSVKIGFCHDIYYDINGEKNPNELGRDIYAFILCKNGGCNNKSKQVRAYYCMPDGTEYQTREDFLKQCSKGGDNAHSCTMLLEENQYEFPKDYPKRL